MEENSTTSSEVAINLETEVNPVQFSGGAISGNKYTGQDPRYKFDIESSDTILQTFTKIRNTLIKQDYIHRYRNNGVRRAVPPNNHTNSTINSSNSKGNTNCANGISSAVTVNIDAFIEQQRNSVRKSISIMLPLTPRSQHLQNSNTVDSNNISNTNDKLTPRSLYLSDNNTQLLSSMNSLESIDQISVEREPNQFPDSDQFDTSSIGKYRDSFDTIDREDNHAAYELTTSDLPFVLLTSGLVPPEIERRPTKTKRLTVVNLEMGTENQTAAVVSDQQNSNQREIVSERVPAVLSRTSTVSSGRAKQPGVNTVG